MKLPSVKFPLKSSARSPVKKTPQSLAFRTRPLTAAVLGTIIDEYDVGMAHVMIVDSGEKHVYLIQEPPLSEADQGLYSLLMESLYYSLKPIETEDPAAYLDQFIWQAAEDLGAVEEVKRSYNSLKYYIMRDSVGYGLVDTLVRDDDIEEISCEGAGKAVAVVHRRYPQFDWLDTNVQFEDEEALKKFVQRLVQKAGKAITTSVPFVDAITKENHRLAATLSNEISLPGSTFDMRKFPKEPLSIGHLLAARTISPLLAAYYWMIMEEKGFVLVIGPTACHDDKTEVLTKEGWVPFKDAKEDVEVFTMNPETHIFEYVKPVRKIDSFYTGPMVSFDGKDVNFSVTPNHTMYLSQGDGKFRFAPVAAINSHSHFKRDGVWVGVEERTFMLKGVASLSHHRYGDIEINMDAWLEFLGWWVAEGSLNGWSPYHYRVVITQKKHKKEVEDVLNRLPFRYSAIRKSTDARTADYVISDKRLYAYLSQFGRQKDRFVPSFIKELPPHQIRKFLAAFRMGDGTIHRGQEIYYTASKRLADGLQELILKSGLAATVTASVSRGHIINDPQANGTVLQRFIKPSVVYRVTTSRKNEPGFNTHAGRPIITQYTGRVYCYTLPKYHLLYTRREGKTFWSGNSGKTTTMNALITLINPGLKIATVEETPELLIPQEHWERLHSRTSYSATADTRYDVDLFDLAKLTLRLRPDYIVVGEARGEEISTLFQAASTGHGALSSFHADSPEAALVRMAAPPLNVGSASLMLMWSLLMMNRIRMNDGSVVRRALVSKEVGMRGELIDMFRWSPKEDAILPADPLEIAQKSYRLQTVAALKGWSVDALAAELAGRAKYLSDIVRSGAYKYADVSAAIQRFYREKYGGRTTKISD